LRIPFCPASASPSSMNGSGWTTASAFTCFDQKWKCSVRRYVVAA
jgi:hypothetical protein